MRIKPRKLTASSRQLFNNILHPILPHTMLYCIFHNNTSTENTILRLVCQCARLCRCSCICVSVYGYWELFNYWKRVNRCCRCVYWYFQC